MHSTAVQNKAAETVEWAHEFLGLTWDQVGVALRTTGRTVQRWRDHESTPNPESEARLDELDELRFWIGAVFDGDDAAAQEWLRARLMDLRGKSPLHEIRAGRIERITTFLATFHEGAHI